MKEVQMINHNNKLANDYFIHISSAPPGIILESELPMRVKIKEIVIATNENALDMIANGSTFKVPFEFEALMIDLARFDLPSISSLTTFMSHAMNREEFIEYYKQKQSGDNVAVYVYKKIK